jgi:hypothetical protein
MTELACPGCGGDMQPTIVRDDWHCDCGLFGPRDVLEALAARLAPAGVLEAAERLLREALPHTGYIEVQFHGDTIAVLDTYADDAKAEARTLADAYAKLKEARHDGG